MDNIEPLHLNADYFHTNNPLNLLADSHDLILGQRNYGYHQSSLFTPEIDNLLAIVDDAAKNILAEFVEQPHKIHQLQTAFGTNWQPSTATNVITDWLTGQQSPQLTIVPENQLYAQGAYSQETNTIYLSQEFLQKNYHNQSAITSVFLEELGHYFDAQLNSLDSPGDEGKIFAHIVQNQSLNPEQLAILKQVDDHAVRFIDGQWISIEKSSLTADSVINRLDNLGDVLNISVNDSETISLLFEWTERDAAYNNEIGVFLVDEQGRVNGINPGEAGYAQAALTSKTRQVLFASGQTVGSWRELVFSKDQNLAFYLIQNNTTEQWLATNPQNQLDENVLAFFSVNGANPDQFNHVKSQNIGKNIWQLRWEDLVNGGDQDFNDVVLNVSLSGLRVPGNLGQSVATQINLVSRDAIFNHEMGLFIVDDLGGRIGELNPGDTDYIKAALSAERRQVIFNLGQTPSTAINRNLQSGKYIGWYLITNGTTEQFLQNNPSNSSGTSLNAFFSYPGANSDGLSHVHYRSDNELAWEDLFGGGDKDYNDLIFNFNFNLITNPILNIFNLEVASDSGTVGDLTTKFDTVTLVGQTEANATVVLSQTGAVSSADSTGKFTFTNVQLAIGDNSFTAQVTDIAGNQNTYSTTIKRLSPPTAINLAGNTVAESSTTGTVIGLLSSIDPDAIDSHTYTLVDDAFGRFRIVGNELQVAEGTLLDFETNIQHSITVKSTDASGLSLIEVFNISVTNVNEAPSFTTTPTNTSIESGSTFIYNILTTDPDVGDTRIITASGMPSWLILTDNGNGSATLQGTPGDNQLSLFNFTLTVQDAGGLSATQNVLLGSQISLTEGTNFAAVRELPLFIPTNPSILTFKIDKSFDASDTDSINDALEVALVDATNGTSLVHTVATGRDAFFNWTEGESVALGAGATYNAADRTVSLNLTGIKAGTTATLVFRLVNNDSDTTTSVTITDLTINPAPPGTQPPVQGNFGSSTSSNIGETLNFNLLSDVSQSFNAEYHRTGFNADTRLLYADIAVRNIGSYSVDAPLIVAVNHISDPTILVRNPDGFTPDGLPYYDLSQLVSDKKLDPNEQTQQRSLVFYNPQGMQFTYDLVVLAQLNQAPVIQTQANKEVIGGQFYSYDVNATDPNGDSLTYKLLVSPDGMTIDSSTGLIRWNTATSNIGNHLVSVEVNDGRGGVTQQQYSLSVIDAPPNRPPVFTSTPVVDAVINTKYTYKALAKDADDDSLSFSLLAAPQGMSIEANTGVVSWTPTGIQLGTYDVKLAVADARGGTAQQVFQVQTQAQSENHAPIIVSDPITQFGITGTTSGAQTTTISTIVRDFRMWGTPDGHPDFERFLTSYPGMVSKTLGDDSTPVFIASNGYGATSASTFYQWYHDTSNVNQRVDVPITLTETAPGSGIWQYSNSSFFPIDNKGFGNQGYGHNFAFTLESHVNFTYKGGEVFNFNGDDDVWVFINDKLVIDLGGVHPPQSASVNLDTLDLTPGQTYALDLFFAERHTTGSSLQIQTSLDFGSQYVYKLKVADADNDSLKYELVQAPTGMSISADGTLSWRPKLSQQGIYSITVKVTDARGGVAIQSFKLNVTPSNPGEIRGTVYRDANGDATKISTEAGLQGRIVYIDENSNGKRDSDEISNVTDANGNYAFTELASGAYNIAIEPQTGWNLTGGTGAVILGDGQILNNINIGTIEAKDPSLNQAPYFVTTPSTTVVEAGKVFRYQAKAQDPDGDGLAYSIVVGNNWGIAIDSSTGVVAWQPTYPVVGSTVDVMLRAADPYGGVVLQPFQIQIVAPNTAPVFTNFPTNQLEATVNYPIQYQFKTQDAEGDPIAYSLDTSAPNGATINPITGVLYWKPTAAGNITFSIIANDNKGGTTSQNITITVSAITINANPFINSQPRKNIALGQTYLYTIQANDPNYDPLTYSLETAPQGMTIDDQGRITWQPGATQIGSNPVSIKVSDGRGGVVTQAFNIDVVSTTSRTNYPPSITSAPNLITNIDRTYEYNLTGSDPDNDLLLWSLDTAPSGMVIDAQSGTLRWQPQKDQIGKHNVKVRLTDARGSFVGQEFTLTVTGTNIPAAIVSNPVTRAAQNQLYTYTVVATDPENDQFTFSLGRKPTGMTIDGNGIIQWIPLPNQIGSQEIEVLVRDSQGAVTTQIYTIEVGTTAINHAPSIISTPVYLAAVGSVYSYQVQATDSDIGDSLTYQLLSVPTGVVGMSINSTTGLLTWNNPVAGNYKIVVGAVDAAGLGAAQGFTLTARVNNPPVIGSNPVLTATPGSIYSYDVIVSDADSDRLTYTLDQVSRDLGMTLDALGRLRWTPTVGNVGNHTVVITVNDGNGGSGQQQYNLLVATDTEAPKVRLIANYDLVYLGESVTFQARATDNIKLAGLQLLINNTAVVLDANGMARYTPTVAGTITAKAYATDTAGNIGQATFNVSVIDTSDVNAPDVSLDLGDNTGSLVTAPIDIRGSILDDGSLDYYRLLVAPVAGGEFKEIAFVDNPNAVTNGVLGKFDPSLLQNDSYILRLEVADNGGHISYSEEVVDVAGELKLGNFRLSFTDLTVPVTGIPITLTRTYDTLTSSTTDDFGYGWRLEFRDTDLRTSLRPPSEEEQLLGYQSAFKDGTKVYITLPGGKREAFTFKPTIDPIFNLAASFAGTSDALVYRPKFVADKGVTSTLTVKDARILYKAGTSEYVGLNGGINYNPADVNFGSVYVLTTKEGIVYEIDGATGDLLTVTDTNGNKLTYTDGGIFSSTGQQVTFERDALGRIAAVTDPMGELVRYGYNANGDLVSVTDQEKFKTQFIYDTTQPHYLKEIIDPLNRAGAKVEYDDDGRLKKTLNATGNSVEIDYDPANSLQTVKDALGNPTTYEYDTRGNVVLVVDALGHQTRMIYDDENNLLQVTDANNLVTKYEYDDKGNLKSRTEEYCGCPTVVPGTSYYSYDKYGNMTSLVTPTGASMIMDYDRFGNMLTMKDGLGNVIQSFTYNGFGQVETETDSTGTTTYQYDDLGNVIKTIDADGSATTMEYYANGKLKRMVEDKGTPNDTSDDEISTFEYDKLGREKFADYGDGIWVKYDYEGAGGDWTKLEAPTIGKIERKLTADGKLAGWVTADGGTPTFKYDLIGRLWRETDTNGNDVTEYAYDAVGRLTSVKDLRTGATATKKYDAGGRVIEEVDTLKVFTRYNYNTRTGRLDSTQSGKYLTNTSGNLILDANNNPLVDTTVEIRTYRYEYNGLQTTVIDPLGRRTTSVVDDYYLPKETIYQLRDGSKFSEKTEYLYANNLQEAKDYPTRIVDISGNDRVFEYDEVGRLKSATDLGDSKYLYTYGDDGLELITSPTGETLRYGYDALGNLAKVTYGDSSFKQMTYNTVDNRLETVTLPSGETITYQYNDAGQVISQTSSTTGAVSFTYTAEGAVKTMTDSTGTTTYRYDSNDRLEGMDYANGSSISYTYDIVGRIQTLTEKGSATATAYTTEYDYDAFGNLSWVKDPAGGITTMKYDVVNRLQERTLPNGVKTIYDYDDLDRVKSIVHTNAQGTVLASVTYEREGIGEPSKIIREDGSYVKLEYDSALRVEKESYYNAAGQLLNETSYTYDASGKRQVQSTSGGSRTFSYSAGYQLDTVAEAGETENYDYDTDGRLTLIERDAKTLDLDHDAYDRLTIVENETTGETTQYIYDGVGNRVKEIQGNQERRFLVAPAMGGGLQSKDLITDGSGNLISNYIYGGGNSPFMRLDTNGNAVYYLTDAMGSVIGLADGQGASAGKFIYDAFGNILLQVGGVDSDAGGDFRFQGQWLESESGLYYFRARDYDPATGLFLSRDTVDIMEMEPESFNPYQFVYNNPYIYSDPTGMFTLVELNSAQNMQDILQSVQYRVRQEVNDYLIDKAKEVVNEVALSALRAIVPINVSSVLSLLNVGDKMGAGSLWGSVASGSVNGQFKNNDENFLDNIYIEVPVNPKTGIPSGNGANIRDFQVFAGSPERAFDLGGNPKDPRPDYILRPDVPKNISEKSWLIGDFKLSVKTVVDDYFENKNKQDQWTAITQHAANYGFRFAGFFTLWSGTSAENERIRKEAFLDGIVVVILSLREKKGFRSPL